MLLEPLSRATSRATTVCAALILFTAPVQAEADHGDWLKSAFRSSEPANSKASRRPVRSEKSVASATSVTGTSGGQSGIASYYWQPQALASGGRFNPNELTAAHKTLPFGTRVRVTNLNNGRSVDVVINDRGPYVAGRVIDLSRRAAEVVGMTGAGLARVSVQTL
jgi:rare lipoprotein A